MSLKLKRGRVIFENAIITNTRTTNWFLILFPKQILQMTFTLYTTWRLIQGLVHRYSSLPRSFRHVFLPQDGENCVKSQKTREACPSANWSHPARDTKVVYNKNKKIHIRLQATFPPPPEALSYYDVLKVNLRPVHAEWSWISNTAFEGLVDHVIHFQWKRKQFASEKFC